MVYGQTNRKMGEKNDLLLLLFINPTVNYAFFKPQ